MTRLLGAILAGGESRRFGSDKAHAEFAGRRLIDHAVAGLIGQVAAVVICGRANISPPGIADRPAGRLGPLAGLNAALHHARRHGFDGVVTIPCDSANIPPRLVATLAAGGPVSYARDAPVIGLWPVALSDVLDRHLATSDDRSLRAWITLCGAQPCDVGDVPNINTPGDLAALSRRSLPA